MSCVISYTVIGVICVVAQLATFEIMKRVMPPLCGKCEAEARDKIPLPCTACGELVAATA